MSRSFSLLIVGAVLLSTSTALEFGSSDVAHRTEEWMNAVVVQSSPSAVSSLFCDDGVLVATAGLGIRLKNQSYDGWGNLKKEGVTIESYFDWFATLPEQNITAFHHNIEKVAENVWVNNAWVNWTWQGNPGITARMTFVFRHTPTGVCIFELHSSQLPASPENDKRRLRSLSQQPSVSMDLSMEDVRQGTEAWMKAVVQESSPQNVTDLFCEDGLLVATAGQGIRKLNYSYDGWGNLKEENTTIKSYFEWFATLPQQKIARYHHNIVEVTPNVSVNNAWVDWTWTGNPGLTARMTFIFRKTATGVCLFELHSSQEPATEPEQMSAAAHHGLQSIVILATLCISLLMPRE